MYQSMAYISIFTCINLSIYGLGIYVFIYLSRTPRSVTVNLSIEYSPSIQLTVSQDPVFEGDTISFACRVSFYLVFYNFVIKVGCIKVAIPEILSKKDVIITTERCCKMKKKT